MPNPTIANRAIVTVKITKKAAPVLAHPTQPGAPATTQAAPTPAVAVQVAGAGLVPGAPDVPVKRGRGRPRKDAAAVPAAPKPKKERKPRASRGNDAADEAQAQAADAQDDDNDNTPGDGAAANADDQPPVPVPGPSAEMPPANAGVSDVQTPHAYREALGHQARGSGPKNNNSNRKAATRAGSSRPSAATKRPAESAAAADEPERPPKRRTNLGMKYNTVATRQRQLQEQQQRLEQQQRQLQEAQQAHQAALDPLEVEIMDDSELKAEHDRLDKRRRENQARLSQLHDREAAITEAGGAASSAEGDATLVQIRADIAEVREAMNTDNMAMQRVQLQMGNARMKISVKRLIDRDRAVQKAREELEQERRAWEARKEQLEERERRLRHDQAVVELAAAPGSIPVPRPKLPEFRAMTTALAHGGGAGDALAGDLDVVGRLRPTLDVELSPGTEGHAYLDGFLVGLQTGINATRQALRDEYELNGSFFGHDVIQTAVAKGDVGMAALAYFQKLIFDNGMNLYSRALHEFYTANGSKEEYHEFEKHAREAYGAHVEALMKAVKEKEEQHARETGGADGAPADSALADGTPPAVSAMGPPPPSSPAAVLVQQTPAMAQPGPSTDAAQHADHAGQAAPVDPTPRTRAAGMTAAITAQAESIIGPAFANQARPPAGDVNRLDHYGGHNTIAAAAAAAGAQAVAAAMQTAVGEGPASPSRNPTVNNSSPARFVIDDGGRASVVFGEENNTANNSVAPNDQATAEHGGGGATADEPSVEAGRGAAQAVDADVDMDDTATSTSINSNEGDSEAGVGVGGPLPDVPTNISAFHVRIPHADASLFDPDRFAFGVDLTTKEPGRVWGCKGNIFEGTGPFLDWMREQKALHTDHGLALADADAVTYDILRRAPAVRNHPELAAELGAPLPPLSPRAAAGRPAFVRLRDLDLAAAASDAANPDLAQRRPRVPLPRPKAVVAYDSVTGEVVRASAPGAHTMRDVERRAEWNDTFQRRVGAGVAGHRFRLDMQYVGAFEHREAMRMLRGEEISTAHGANAGGGEREGDVSRDAGVADAPATNMFNARALALGFDQMTLTEALAQESREAPVSEPGVQVQEGDDDSDDASAFFPDLFLPALDPRFTL